jgi:hypothetical protein
MARCTMNPISRTNLRAASRSMTCGSYWPIASMSLPYGCFSGCVAAPGRKFSWSWSTRCSWRKQGGTHRIGHTGASIEVHLGDGRRLETMSVGAVLNRLTWPPLLLPVGVPPVDAAYAQSEARAFAMSWIRSLAPVIVNAPTSQGLCGRWRPPVQWRILGSRAGLPVAPIHMSSLEQDSDNEVPFDSTVVLVMRGQLLCSGAPTVICDGARRLAEMSETAILGLRFVGADPPLAAWRLLDATPQPDLRIAGERGVAALEELLAA